MTDSSGTPSDAERNLRMALSIGVMDPRLRAACEAVLTALAALQSELKAAKARMWENGHALETAQSEVERLRDLESHNAALRSEGERYRELLERHLDWMINDECGWSREETLRIARMPNGLNPKYAKLLLDTDAALSSAPPSDSVGEPPSLGDLLREAIALAAPDADTLNKAEGRLAP